MSLTLDDVEILSRKTVFKGYFQVDRYHLRHRSFAGGWVEAIREVFERGHAVVVVLYDPDRDAVALIEQFRCGAVAANAPPWQIECVAGIIEPEEPPAEVALREVREEAGVQASDLLEIGTYLVTPGGSSETCRLYCARVDASQVGGIHGIADENEDIRVFTVPLAEAYAMVKDGRITNAMTVLGIQWLMLERETLRQRWC